MGLSHVKKQEFHKAMEIDGEEQFGLEYDTY